MGLRAMLYDEEGTKREVESDGHVDVPYWI